MHRCIAILGPAIRVHIVSRPKYRDTYRDTTCGTSSYVSACIAIQVAIYTVNSTADNVLGDGSAMKHKDSAKQSRTPKGSLVFSLTRM